MNAEALEIAGAMLLHGDMARDSRGLFATLWDSLAFPGAPAFRAESAHLAVNDRTGTLRGLHFQRAPHEQAKLVACAAGRLWDVILDLRPASATYLRWQGVETKAGDGRALFVPRGCAHGYVTLEPATVVSYLIEGAYSPDAAGIVRWDDPAFGIAWPVKQPTMSDRDRGAQDFRL